MSKKKPPRRLASKETPKDDVDRNHSCYRPATLTNRSVKLVDRKRPFLPGKKSRRLRQKQWVPV